jgi:hypothetical protein
MMNKDEMIDLIVTTPIERIEGPIDVWESHIELDDHKTLIVGYKGEESFCEEETDEECVVTYSWYWELRNSENWDLIQENHDSDLTFCTPSQKDPWSDESTFEEIGDLSSSKICTFSDQNHIEDIAEDIVDEIEDWLDND